MVIQWFPGHMAKARREVTEKLKLVDVIFELVDARIPLSSSNPMLEEIIHQKKRVIILNKSDAADEKITAEWVAHFKEKGLLAVPVNAQQGKNLHAIERAAQELMAEKFARQKERGMRPRAIRAMILGIPNVGKSTLINRLVKKNIAKTGNKPGVTKAQQWIKVGKTLELLDTPGILWPKFEDQEVGFKLALTGAIKDDLLNMEEIALYGLHFLEKNYPNQLAAWLGLPDYAEKTDTEILAAIAIKHGYFDKYKDPDYSRAAEWVVREIRQQKIGRFSFDLPEKGEEI
ncbi:ribosome biogenesis GTPase YlqF [Listeria fleischmannii]|jgi:ribosome biogenesis GTPase A|uniref:Ribosome biogenesis GTPase A n=2 Tax=Listeria fleischmannii TaxID=1069827 RepID=W7DC23_9LIST|nr:ribosome biogenesis GTPase YlqF [Listeria fleischmannii]EIA20815.1 GTPase YlqF [Listeria fleischmannii subsp. coloradonensis]EUJ45051.1 GTPase YlqF [Listeria fleischmannii FSL S10-1203]MBC1397421.1 ribosome biogenesis GTPase YlqF [Listeria fleischmannii]MBC1418442.1 ribosome biogenesis GTPase YlqF [Listeria fleischmannii]MBC1425790.1 ribosome biogenesis GTPase YlqF [Listeria fleischmannii]